MITLEQKKKTKTARVAVLGGWADGRGSVLRIGLKKAAKTLKTQQREAEDLARGVAICEQLGWASFPALLLFHYEDTPRTLFAASNLGTDKLRRKRNARRVLFAQYAKTPQRAKGWRKGVPILPGRTQPRSNRRTLLEIPGREVYPAGAKKPAGLSLGAIPASATPGVAIVDVARKMKDITTKKGGTFAEFCLCMCMAKLNEAQLSRIPIVHVLVCGGAYMDNLPHGLGSEIATDPITQLRCLRDDAGGRESARGSDRPFRSRRI